MRARVSGYLQAVNFADGAMVKEGDVLFVIDPRPYQAAVDRAKADLASAKARLELATANSSAREALVETAGRRRRRRFDERTAGQRRAPRPRCSRRGRAAGGAAQPRLHQVRAPISGRVSNRRVDVGNLVTGDPNATLLTTIVTLDPIYFVFDMSEARFPRLPARGRARRPALDARRRDGRAGALPDERTGPHPGTMNFVDNASRPGSGTIRARAMFPNPDLFITPGQFGRLRLPGSNEYEAMLIPDSAIVTDQSNRIVMTVAEDGTVVPKPIRPGPSQPGGLRIVREGLTGDETIIINGLVRARPGGKVTPEPGIIAPRPTAADS